MYQKFTGVTVSYTRTDPSTGMVTSGTQTTPAETQYGHYVFTYPSYTSNQFAYDIALVKLPAPFPEDPLLQPAELPWFAQIGAAAELASMQINDPSPPPPGKVSVMRGTIAASGCNPDFDQVCLIASSPTNACTGDSGSGVVTRANGINYVTGIGATINTAHFGDECGADSTVAATDVSRYLDWIDTTIRGRQAIPTPTTQDILWRSSSSGAVGFWFMNMSMMVEDRSLIANPGSDWIIKGIGDFDGDGVADILWRNSSNLAIWFMNDGSAGGTIRQQAWPADPGQWWIIQGIGDFDGDGRSDILWRTAASDGLAIWFMNGSSHTDRYPADPGSWWTIRGGVTPMLIMPPPALIFEAAAA